MRKQINPNIKAHLTRSAFYLLLLLLAICMLPFVLAQRTGSERIVTKVRSASRRLVRFGNVLPANIIPVTNINDSGPGSLRDALAMVNDGDTIDATGVSGTILLTSGELQINHNVTINGSGAGNLAVNGNAIFRVFENFATNITISGVTITNGFDRDGAGGGILSAVGATVTITDSTIISNHAGCGGGGISIDGGTLTVTNSTISGNSVGLGAGCMNGGVGGGISIYGGTLTVNNSTINGNAAGGIGGHGGGIWLAGEGIATITESTLSDNFGNYGGGILSDAQISLTIKESTLSGNSASNPGGSILSFGQTTIGDAVLNAGEFGGTIVNDGGTVTSLGYNLASDDGGGVLTGPGDQINTDPMLSPLQDNGGPTFTHALLPGSPAVNAGDPNFTPPPSYDQRGPNYVRVYNGRIDIGSFEVQPRPTPTPRPRPTPAPRP